VRGGSAPQNGPFGSAACFGPHFRNSRSGSFCGPEAPRTRWAPPFWWRSGEDRPYDVAVDVGETEVAALELEGELLVVDA
jgi:hypothetical protein